jgi:hypothetical protein
VPDQRDYITADFADTAVKNLLPCIDAEAVVAAAYRTWADQFGTDTFQLDAATCDLVFDPNGAGAITQV